MSKLFIGNQEIGGGGVNPVNSLPTANKTEYDKHKLYLQGTDLYFLNSVLDSNLTIEEKNTSLRSARKTGVGLKDNKVYRIAGQQSNTYIDVISYYDIESNTETTLATTFPTILSDFGDAQYNNHVYIFGGATGGNGTLAQNKIYRINLNTLDITLLNATCQRGMGVTSCRVGNYIYTFGGGYAIQGMGWYYLKTITMFDVEAETITTLSAELINSNYTLTSVAVGTTIYLIGGSRDNNIYAFDTINQTVTKVWDYDSSVGISDFYFYNGFNVGTMIYLVGGKNNTKRIFTFDTTTNTLALYTQAFSHSLDFSPVIAKIDDGTFYIIGDIYAEKVYFATNISYKKITSTNE